MKYLIWIKEHPLKFILWAKIVFTISLWITPLLLLSLDIPTFWTKWKIPKNFGMDAYPRLILGLLAGSYIALTISYWKGLKQIDDGHEIKDTIWVGIWSNGLAFLALILGRSTWLSWENPARFIFGLSAFLTLCITLALCVVGLVALPRTHAPTQR